MQKKSTKHLRFLLLAAALILGAIVPAPVRAWTRYETGISTGTTLLWMDESKLGQRLDDIKALGAVWVRIDFSWPDIQPDSFQQFKWGQYDRVMNEVAKRDMKVLALLAYTPHWAQEPQCANRLRGDPIAAQKCNPRSAEEFGRFARAIAMRYKTLQLRAWEIWNEPNRSAYWKTLQPDGQLAPDPIAYARFANAAAREIRRHHPDSVIVTGGLSPMFEPRYPQGARQSDYLTRLLPALEKHLFDAIGMHPYCWPVLPEKEATYNAYHTIDKDKPNFNLRTIMSGAGWADKEIWATEYGASTKGVRSSIAWQMEGGERPDHVTEDLQAQIVGQGVAQWFKKPNVGPIFVYNDSDQWLIQQRNEGGFGLRRDDGSEKPSYGAFKRAAKALPGR